MLEVGCGVGAQLSEIALEKTKRDQEELGFPDQSEMMELKVSLVHSLFQKRHKGRRAHVGLLLYRHSVCVFMYTYIHTYVHIY